MPMTPEAAINARLLSRRTGLRVEITGRLVTVIDETMPGLSWSLPMGLPWIVVPDAAVGSARKRRAFIRGEDSVRSAA